MRTNTIIYCGRSAHLLASNRRAKDTLYVIANILLLSMTFTLGLLGLAIMGD